MTLPRKEKHLPRVVLTAQEADQILNQPKRRTAGATSCFSALAAEVGEGGEE